jgi:hypothetical protein
MSEETPIGKIIVDVFKNRDLKVDFKGNLDGLNFPTLTSVLRNEFFGTYSLRRREEEIKNLENNARIQREEKLLAEKIRLEKIAEEEKKAKDLKEKSEKAAKELQEKILKENLKIEAERILKKDAARKAQQGGNPEEIAWANKQLENANESKEATTDEFKI